MNTVCCFYWQGDRWQESENYQSSDTSFKNHLKRTGTVTKELATKYINNLYQGICRYTLAPFKFVCFSNETLPAVHPDIELRFLPMLTTKGVLPRMFMFSEEAGLFGDQVLSLDLDLIITGPLDDLLGYDGLFCTRKSWTRGEETLIDGDIMSFTAGKMNEDLFWKPLKQDIEKVEAISNGGRERLWVRHVMQTWEVETWDSFIPNQIVSYKHHIRPLGHVPSETRIISCHGYPRPHQIKDKWRMEYWK